MANLNDLEKAVLEQMLQQVPADVFPLLKEQLDAASVASRKNTGAGFYTRFEIKPISRPIEARVIGDVRADIEGFDQPMLFLLFLKDGVIRTLEGAAIVDSTVNVDFSKVRFAVKRS
jgi:hypothetical protein